MMRLLFGLKLLLRLCAGGCAVEFFKLCNVRLRLTIQDRLGKLRAEKSTQEVSDKGSHHRHSSGLFSFIREASSAPQMPRQIIAPLQFVLGLKFLAAVRAGFLFHRIALSASMIARSAVTEVYP